MRLNPYERAAVDRTLAVLDSWWTTLPFGLKRGDLEVTLNVLRRLVDEQGEDASPGEAAKE